ncbi:MAG: response regulator [Betaproteobacteria bacterium]|nr:response regulator [Betaproteobacteria bacterium]
MTAHILIVEDEPKLATLMRDYLVSDGFTVDWLDQGGTVVDAIKTAPPDLLLLDLMLPGKDGFTICKALRGFTDLPIIMVTARVEEIDRLIGLDLGADDYVCKPFSPRELVARVKALLRRTARSSGPSALSSVLHLDGDRFEARYHGAVVALTAVEFRLLEALVAARGRVLSRNQLMDAAYVDHRVVSDRTVDSHVKNVRKKLTGIRADEDPIRSIYGLGYRLEV